jgi:hypothetical protein
MAARFHRVKWGGYPFDVLLCVGASTQEVIAKCEEIGWKLSRREQRALAGDSDGGAFMLDTANTIIMLDKWDGGPECIGTLCHETFHAMWALMEHIGVKPTSDSEEAMAYALDDITTSLIRALVSASPIT